MLRLALEEASTYMSLRVLHAYGLLGGCQSFVSRNKACQGKLLRLNKPFKAVAGCGSAHLYRNQSIVPLTALPPIHIQSPHTLLPRSLRSSHMSIASIFLPSMRHYAHQRMSHLHALLNTPLWRCLECRILGVAKGLQAVATVNSF